MCTRKQLQPHSASAPLPSQHIASRHRVVLSRRDHLAALTLALQVTLPSAAQAGGTAPSSAVGLALGLPQPSAQQQRRIDPKVAAAFTQAVYDSIMETKLMSEAEFQAQNFKLRDREYRYYYEANKDRLERVPDLSDSSGGLSNPVYFNFIYYILWKQIARKTGPEQREVLGSVFGNRLVDSIAPGSLERLQVKGSKAPIETVQLSIQQVLSTLESSGYAAKTQVVWGKSNSDLPYMWESMADSEESTLFELGDAAGLANFQIRVRLPADIEGSVSLRQEEDGFWSQPVSHMVEALLEASGYSPWTVDELFFQDTWVPPTALVDRIKLFLGDPLQDVEVPWQPQSLILNFSTATT